MDTPNLSMLMIYRVKRASLVAQMVKSLSAKAGEIFEKLLGTNPYEDLKEAGYELRPIKIGQE